MITNDDALGKKRRKSVAKTCGQFVSHLLLVELLKKEEKLAIAVERSYPMKVFHFSKPVYRSLTCPKK